MQEILLLQDRAWEAIEPLIVSSSLLMEKSPRAQECPINLFIAASGSPHSPLIEDRGWLADLDRLPRWGVYQ
jgi:hypothetical protein